MTRILAVVRRQDRRLTRQVAAWDGRCVPTVLRAAQQAAEHTVLWWGAATIMAAAGGQRGRSAAGAGLAGMVLAEVLSNGVGKQLVQRPRPPGEWIPGDEVEARPDSSSFPSGHTAAGVAFAVATVTVWPRAGALCAVPAVAVAVGRVHSGAHYPTDVAAGAAVGLGAAGLTCIARRRLIRQGR